MVFVALSELRELCTKSLSTLGYSPQEVSVLLEVSRDHHVQLCMKQHLQYATPTGSCAVVLCCWQLGPGLLSIALICIFEW